MIGPSRVNTVIYCDGWPEAVAFYRVLLGREPAFENEWFVEFELTPDAFVSVADATRASVLPGDGRGITLSWEVPDVDAASATLAAAGVDVGELRTRFGSPTVDLHDPAGNRIELWSRT